MFLNKQFFYKKSNYRNILANGLCNSKSKKYSIHNYSLMKQLAFTLLVSLLNLSFVFAHGVANDKMVHNNSYIDNSLADKEILSEALTRQIDEHSFHLFSHGKAGQLFLNNQWLSDDDLVTFIQPLLKNKSQLNIYGCHFAQGEKGRAAVEYLETALGVSVAASNDLTGIDGDWDLEVGQTVSALNVTRYAHNLQCAAGSGEVSGTVWDDTDFNGAMNESPIVGVQDVEVNIYDCDGNLVQTMTCLLYTSPSPRDS